MEKIGTDLAEFKDEMYSFRDEMYRFKDEMYRFKDEVNERFDKNEREFKEFRKEVNDRFNQFSQDVANEIHGVSKMMNDKIEREIRGLKNSLRIRVEWKDNTRNKIHIL